MSIKDKIIEPIADKMLNSLSYEKENNNVNNQFDNDNLPLTFEIGRAYYVETYTKYWHFHVKGFTKEGFIIAEHIAWIADTGKYSIAHKDNGFSEIEAIAGIAYLAPQSFIFIKPTPLIILETK